MSRARTVPLCLFHSPGQLFSDFRATPRWQTSFWLLCAGTVLAGFLVRPFILAAAAIELQPLLDATEIAETIQQMKRWYGWSLLLTPLPTAGKCLAGAGAAWLLVYSMGLAAGFKRLFAVFAASSLVNVLEGFFVVMVLMGRGVEAIQSAGDLRVLMGLNLVLNAAAPSLDRLLGSVNPFQLWYVWLLSLGIARTHECSFARGALVASTVWAGSLVFQLIAEGHLQRYMQILR
ncbi:MAG: hypothetical protein HY645_11360 [Acidobacteria bacterium]|nr:hypothetical protein [Acidobacteriota bacterium]